MISAPPSGYRGATALVGGVNGPATVGLSAIVAFAAFSLVTPRPLSDVIAAGAALIAMMMAAEHVKGGSGS